MTTGAVHETADFDAASRLMNDAHLLAATCG
jgi:hypothetical protein